MKRILSVLFVLLSLTVSHGAPSQVELIAEVTEIVQDGDSTEFMLSLTGTVDFKVIVTDQTEIRDEDDNPLNADELMVGTFS